MSLEVYSSVSNSVKFRPLEAGDGISIDDSTGSIVVSAGAAETSGPFTPGIGDASNQFSGVVGAGTWTRVGNLVTFQGTVVWTGLGSATGAVRITGLPAMPTFDAAITVGRFSGIIYTSQVLATQTTGNSFAFLDQADKTGGPATSLTAASNFAASGGIAFSGTYYAA